MAGEQDTVDAVHAVYPVSRETEERLRIYVALLQKWQASQNLVSPATLLSVWRRHMADSVQTLAVYPDAQVWADVGSGAGFPGLVTAILLAGRDGAHVHLVESNKGKAAFLRTVARETGAPVTVHADRIEAVLPKLSGVQAVSARALAAFDQLLNLTWPLLSAGAVGVFHKGQDFASERAEASANWTLDVVEHPSRIDPAGRIVVVRHASPLITPRGSR